MRPSSSVDRRSDIDRKPDHDGSVVTCGPTAANVSGPHPTTQPRRRDAPAMRRWVAFATGAPARPLDFAAMPTFRAPRGTRDLLPAERATFRRLETIATDLTRRYGYHEIETPLFEQAAVFERGVGAVTDVVEKELFLLAPRTEEAESWALRPEPTAGIVRAYVQHGMQTLPQPVKLTMTGPMFRYDRPQAGRYRQFWQLDAEAIGDPGPAIDAEIIELALRFYREAGLGRVDVHLNSIGDAACRPAYIEELTAYFRGHVDELPQLERCLLYTSDAADE